MSRTPSRLVRSVLFFAMVGVTANLTAQIAPEFVPKYDLKAEMKVKGTVEELKLPAKGREKQSAHLIVKNEAEMIDVFLCPEAFLKDMGVSFAKGDAIALTGSKVRSGNADLILAREVVKGNDTLVLRDGKGVPVWNWHH